MAICPAEVQASVPIFARIGDKEYEIGTVEMELLLTYDRPEGA